MFENCTMQPKVLCKMPGSQSFKAGEVDFSTGWVGWYERGHIFPHKVLQMILLQLICQLHRWCASAALKTAQICPETYVLKRLPKLKSICIATVDVHAHCMARRKIWVFTSCSAKLLSRAALGTKLILGFSPVPWLLQPAA